MEELILIQLQCDLDHAKEDLAMFDKESEKASYNAFNRLVLELTKMVEYQETKLHKHN